MKGKIDAARLLVFMQQHLTRESVFLCPNPQTLFSVEAKEFWDFVLSEIGATPDELNAFLDATFPEDRKVGDVAADLLARSAEHVPGIPAEISALLEIDWHGRPRLPTTEWQCAECAHANERIATQCDDCGAPYEKTREAES